MTEAQSDVKQRLLGVAIELATQLAVIHQLIEECDKEVSCDIPQYQEFKKSSLNIPQ